LSDVRLSDIALKGEGETGDRDDESSGLVSDEALVERREVEGLEDMLASMSAGSDRRVGVGRPAMDEMKQLRKALEELCVKVGLEVDFRSSVER